MESQKERDNIKMDLRERERHGIGWTDLGQDRDRWRALLNIVMNHQDPQNIWKFLST
jgi:hypothetical protein